MKDDFTVNLDDLESDGMIACPYCCKGKQYMYGTKGLSSHACDRCHRMVLWDFDNKTAYKAKVRRFAS